MTSSPSPQRLPVEERLAIIRGIQHGYGRMRDRFVDEFVEVHANKTGEAAAEHYRRFLSGQKLLRRRARDVGFNAYVIQEVLGRGDLQLIRDRLLRGVLGSLVLESQLRHSILERRPSERKSARERGSGIRGAGRGLEPEIIGRFMRNWRDIFTESLGSKKAAVRYSSVFDPLEIPEPSAAFSEEEYTEYMKRQLENELLGYPAHMRPEYLRSLSQFIETWTDALRSLSKEEGAIASRIQWLQSQVSPLTHLPLVLHNAIVDVICLHWIADNRRDDLRTLQTQAPLELTSAQAKEVREVLEGLVDPELTRRALYVGGLYHKRWEDYRGACLLWKEALALDGLPVQERATLLSSIGIVHRDQGNPKLAVRSFLDAVQFLRQTDTHYELALALKNLGECRMLNGHEGPARGSYAEAFAVSATLPQDAKRDAAWNLALSLRRSGLRDLEREALEIFTRTDPVDTDEVIYSTLRLTELGPLATGPEVPAPFLRDPAGATPDERRVFTLKVSERTLEDEIVPGPDRGFEELMDEVQPLLEKPFRASPGGAFGFRHVQAPPEPNEYSRVVLCFSQEWVSQVDALAAKYGFSSRLLMAETTQIVTQNRLELLDALTGQAEPAVLTFDESLKARLAEPLTGLFDRFRGELPSFYLFHILSVEDAVADALYHFFGVRPEDGRDRREVHGTPPKEVPAWYPEYWRWQGTLSRQERRRRERR